MNKPKRQIAGVMLTFATLLAGPLHAAPFDEKLKAPRAATSQALRTQLKAHFAAFERNQQQEDPAAFIRDRVAHRQWSDLFFCVKLAMDEGTPLGDLGAFGMAARPDGSYAIDLQEFPQWDPLDARLHVLTNPEVVESWVPALQVRGFREEDLTALRTYLATHDPQLTTQSEGRQLIETFAKRLRAQRQAGRPLNLQEVLAYRYQKASIKAEAQRQWAIGLLDSLDLQRQRVLVSFLDEFHAELTFGAPTDSFDATLQGEAQPILSGDYAGMIAADEARIRQDLERRAEKLIGGERR